ncbi:MAG: hypothetical protein PVH37_24315, partial [Desulfobacterales bacterium]
LHELAIPHSVKEAVGRRLSRLTETCGDVFDTERAVTILADCSASRDGILKERKPLSRSKKMYLSAMQNSHVYVKKGRATF